MKVRAAWLFIAIAACASPSPRPMARPEPAPVPVSSVKPDSGSIARDPSGDPLELAYRAWFAEGTTPAVVAKFKAIVDAEPQRSQEKPSLVAAVSDDGAMFLIGHANSAWSYSATAKTGNPTAQFPSGYGLGNKSGDLKLSEFFSNTHVIAIVEKGGDLVVRDLDAKTELLRVPGQLDCPAAHNGTRLAYLTGQLPHDAPSDQVPKNLTGHVWDVVKRAEVDSFPISDARPTDTGCLRLVTPAIVGVAWGATTRSIRLRDVDRHKDLATVSGGSRGPVTSATPDGRYVIVAPNHGITVQPPPEKVSVVDTTNGAIVATSSVCSAPTSLAVDGKGQNVAVGDVRDVCILGLPKLNLVKRTTAIRGPYTKEETERWRATWPIRQLVFFGDNALLAYAQDSKYVVYKLPSGEIALKGERGWDWYLEGSGANAVAHTFEVTSQSPVVRFSRHIRVMPDLKIIDDKPPEDFVHPMFEGPLAALVKLQPRFCLFNDRLFPREACPALKP